MADDIDNETAESMAALKAEVTRLVTEKFGSDEITVDLDDMLTYHDVHQVLGATNVQAELERISASAPNEDEVAEYLSTLNHQVEGLRRVFYAASYEQSEEICTSLARTAFLDEAETTQLRELIKLYASALQLVKSPEEVGGINPDTSAMLRCLTSEVITRYLGYCYTSKHWLANTLFDSAKFDLSQPPSTWVQMLFDEAHYTALIPIFEKIGQPFLADIARLYLSFKHTLMGNLMQLTVNTELQQAVTQLDRYDSTEFTKIELDHDFSIAAYIHNMTRVMLAIHPSSIPLSDRLVYLEKAQQYCDSHPIPVIQTLGLVLRFHRAQLLQGSEREKLELSAIDRLHELLVQCVLQKDPTDRVWNMTTLILSLAAWKLNQGDFRGAIEFALMAKAFVGAGVKLYQDDFQALLEELEKGLADPDTTEEDRKMISGMRKTIPEAIAQIEMVARVPDLFAAISRAKLAESQADFVQAAEIYQEAAYIQRQIMDRMRSVIEAFHSVVMESQKDSYYSLEFDTLAAYFHGMALLNRGDQHLMEGDYAAAKQSYSDARLTFEATVSLWVPEAEGLPGIMPEHRFKARREQKMSTLRMRHCDAKLEIVEAEQYSTLGRLWQAAKHFEKAAGLFAELLESAVFKDESRNIEIFKASEDYCKGRWLLEMDRSTRRQDNVEEGCSLLDSAALCFEQSGERQWAGYIEGLRYEYEATNAWESAKTSAEPNTATHLMHLAQSKAHDAAVIFRQLGIEKRASYLEGWSRTLVSTTSYMFSRIVLPKPLDLALREQSPIEVLIAQLTSVQRDMTESQDGTEDHLRGLQARAIALSHRLDDIKDRRNRGRIDEGRYTDLVADLDRERIEILQNVRKVLQGSDEDLDAILLDAISCERETSLMDRLAQVAQRKGLNQHIVEALNKRQESMAFWLIEVGIQLVKQADQR